MGVGMLAGFVKNIESIKHEEERNDDLLKTGSIDVLFEEARRVFLNIRTERGKGIRRSDRLDRSLYRSAEVEYAIHRKVFAGGEFSGSRKFMKRFVPAKVWDYAFVNLGRTWSNVNGEVRYANSAFDDVLNILAFVETIKANKGKKIFYGEAVTFINGEKADRKTTEGVIKEEASFNVNKLGSFYHREMRVPVVQGDQEKLIVVPSEFMRTGNFMLHSGELTSSYQTGPYVGGKIDHIQHILRI